MNTPPLNNYPAQDDDGRFGSGWSNWFTQVFLAGRAWNKSFTTTATIDFGSIAAQNQLASSAIALTGARVGDGAQVYATADVSGVIFAATVTANDQVTVYAKNFTAGAINPASQTFRIIILQN